MLEDIVSPGNPVPITQSECFTIPNVSNLSHTSIFKDSDASFTKTSSIRKKKTQENKCFENELLKLETQKINVLLESNKPQMLDDEDMMFLESLHPYFKNMDNLQKLRVRNEIQTVLINQLSI